jgi:FkbM family methyltransferase
MLLPAVRTPRHHPIEQLQMQRRDAIRLANELLSPLPIRVESARRLASLEGEHAELERARMRLVWLAMLGEHDPKPESLPRSQLGQDLFVLWTTSFKREGFFVEFGAAGGLDLSNTVLLERSFAWDGIVAEPARRWHDDLKRHRQCIIDTRCVWGHSGQSLSFKETAEAEYSTVSQFAGREDGNQERRASGTEYQVDTVSLNDLLEQHAAPTRIDYLSVDTEGSEFEILSAFDFTRHEIGVLTVEHNDDPAQRYRLFELLTGQGFNRVLEQVSYFEDWYVNRELVPLGSN